MPRRLSSLTLLLLVLLPVFGQVLEDEDDGKDPILNYSVLSQPFRMQKINLMWEKARKNLQEGKLKVLYSELKMQDKEELTLKKMKAEGGAGDKDGLLEAEVRKNFNGIVNKYGLLGLTASEEAKIGTYDQPRAYFKDKKLNRLWEKAEKAGMSEEELITLKQEFKHHQEKVEQFHNLLELADSVGQDQNNQKNDIHLNEDETEEEIAESYHFNELNGKSKELKEDYHRLHRLATNQRPDGEFAEEKVESLWRLANHVDFSEEELESIKTELHHFEIRLQKLQHLQSELAEVDARKVDPSDLGDLEKTQGRKRMDQKVETHKRKIDRMQKDLEYRISSRHTEL